MPSQLLKAVIADLQAADPADRAQLAELLAPHLELPAAATGETPRWLNSAEAAEYLGMTVNALHKLTAAQSVPFEQDTPRGKLWFQTQELDAWRRRELRRVAA
ncbi:MAG TPA: hypothetical protein VHV75_14940 [Solirubrobacteraceae bacterium]|jgi:hypothetical protein|nr:hypothetical protein [Solirubrobacteraceae bacterium]